METSVWLKGLAALDVSKRTSRPDDPTLVQMAHLDCDWHAECARCFDQLAHPGLSFLPSRVLGPSGFAQLIAQPTPSDEESWFVSFAHHPQQLKKLAGPVFAALRQRGMRILFYAFDEASRMMPCFRDIAPHLDVLIHDETPLDPSGLAVLRPDCVRVNRSWVANLLPFQAPFNETPEESILFLGSEMGYTPHRRRQVEFLQKRFGQRFTAHHDHSIPVGDRLSLTRFKVGLCPEGRKFASPHMARMHTDRPFWSGCLGMVPVSEDSAQGGRLEELHRDGLILRYAHGDLESLAACCEKALAAPTVLRRRIYDHFNAHETVGSVIASLIAATPRV